MFKGIKKMDRFQIMKIVLILMMLILLGRLFSIMIIKGEEYRYIADNKRVKTITLSAPRGNIYDRNGKLLAGTKLSFAVKLYKDELSQVELKEKNQMFKDLAYYLEEEGTAYIEKFPITFHAFIYPSEDIYYKEKQSPTSKVIDIIFENNLQNEVLNAYTSEGGFDFAIVKSVINSLDLKGITIPVRVSTKSGLDLEYIEGKELEEFLLRNHFSKKTSPMEAIYSLVKDDKSTFYKVLDQPLGRKLAYSILQAHKLEANILLADKVLAYDEEYRIQKGHLHQLFPQINAKTDVKEDFIAVVTSAGLGNLLQSYYTLKDETKFIPIDILFELLKNKGVQLPVTYTLKGKNQVDIQFVKKTPFSRELPIDRLIRIAKEQNVLNDFILDQRVAPYAQSAVLETGINPKINVKLWEYTAKKDKSDLLERYKQKDASDMDALFHAMKEYYDLECDSDYIARGVLSFYDRLMEQGHYGYVPITLTYGLTQEGVSRIEEAIPNNKGIEVSIEPIRYYPERDLAAHVIGYMGKISQEEEIKKYVEELGYSSDEMIGKTGIEESYEEILHGKKGMKKVEIDVMGNRTKTLEEVSPEQGGNVFLAIDSDLQKVAHDALRKTLLCLQNGENFSSEWGEAPLATNEGTPYYNANAGAVVVMDIKTGEILAKVNDPTFNLNPFATGISASDWKALFPENEKDAIAPRPLYDIAMQTAVQPGSIFKLCSTLAAFEKGLSPDEMILDSGVVTIGDTDFGCHIWNDKKATHGWVDSRLAIQESCNYYFYALALGENQTTHQPTGVQLTIDDLISMAKKLGLGEPTGIEINNPQEVSGLVPDPDSKIQIRKKQLEEFLTKTIEKYFEKDYQFNDNDIKWSIHTIVSWLDEKDVLSREKVVEGLEDLHLEAETPLKNEKVGLADIIKYDYLNQSSWDITDTLNVIIGQGPNAYTPLQMVRYMSVFANGGYKLKARVVGKVMNKDNTEILEQTAPAKVKVDIKDPAHLKPILEGMHQAKNVSGVILNSIPMEVGIKTGTAENLAINPNTGRNYDNYAWFLCFAPYEEPKIAIATILFQGGSGINAAALNREIIAKYFNLKPPSAEE